jgi:hypothetical protein
MRKISAAIQFTGTPERADRLSAIMCPKIDLCWNWK